MEIIIDNIPSIVAVVIVVLILIKLWFSGRQDSVKELILDLVIKSEIAFGNGTGEIKYASVVAGIYRVLPPIVVFFISEKELDNMIEGAVKEMKRLCGNDAMVVREILEPCDDGNEVDIMDLEQELNIKTMCDEELSYQILEEFRDGKGDEVEDE